MFASLPGVSAPPPFGGSQRTVVVRVDPDRLRVLQDVARRGDQGPRPPATRSARRATSASATRCRSSRSTSMVGRTSTSSATIPIRPGASPTVYLRDVATVAGRHRHHRPATRWSTAGGRSTSSSPSGPTPRRSPSSTNVKDGAAEDAGGAARRHQGQLRVRPVAVRHRRRCGASATEGLLGAVLTGLMVLLFLRDWRSVIVVVLNIPLALLRRRRRPVADRADDQPDDARRPGAGGRHPRRRGDRRGREHPHADGAAPTRSPWRCGGATRRRPSRGCWRCSASWRCSSRRSSCRGRPGRCSCRCRWPSASRWSPLPPLQHVRAGPVASGS